MKNVLIVAYTEQNLGDDMFITYLCAKYPSTHFYMFCPLRYQNAFRKLANLTLLSSQNQICSLPFDLQIIIGGSIFMESANKHLLEKFFSDKRKLISHLETHVIGANFGPYRSSLFPVFYKFLFCRLKEITFRDKQSYNLFKLNNMRWAPDILLNYHLPKRINKNTVLISCIKKNSRSGLINYDEDKYYSMMIRLSEYFFNMGYKIILACFSIAQEDDVAAKNIFDRLSTDAQKRTEVLAYKGDIDTFLKSFMSASYIVGARFHSIILGWNAGIPTFPICYNNKMENAIESYGFHGKYISIDKIDKLTLKDIQYNQNLIPFENIGELKSKALTHFQMLDKVLL